jgi:transcriptional regulator with XRE-family HTH domain
MNDIAEDFKQIKISRLTLGLIMSVAITSGVVVWNAAQVAGRIGDLENTVQVIEQGNNTSDSAVLARLDALERQIAGINPVSTEEVEEDLIDIEELIQDLELQVEDYSYQLGDLWWRTDMLLDAISSQPWGDEFLRQQFGPQPGW